MSEYSPLTIDDFALSSEQNPTVLQVIPALDTGGAEQTTVDVARALIQNGFRALVASRGGRMEAELAASGANLIRMPLDSRSPPMLAVNAARLARQIRLHRVALVHARSRAPAWCALAAARACRVPFVTTYHGIYNASNPLKRLYNSVMVRSNAVIANSGWTAAHIIKEHGVAREDISVIPRGIDLQKFDPAGVTPDRIESFRAQWKVQLSDVVILLPGRLTRWKGQLVLVDALAHLRSRGRLHNVRAVLAGDAQGRVDYVAELRGSIAARNLEKTVVIAGAVLDMPAAYLASDIVVSASTDPEAFGRVAAEAGAMGRPVIATDHGGTRETVIANESALLVPPGDADALARAIQNLLAIGQSGRAAMGGRGRSHVRQHFSVDRMCADTLAVYRRLLAK